MERLLSIQDSTQAEGDSDSHGSGGSALVPGAAGIPGGLALIEGMAPLAQALADVEVQLRQYTVEHSWVSALTAVNNTTPRSQPARRSHSAQMALRLSPLCLSVFDQDAQGAFGDLRTESRQRGRSEAPSPAFSVPSSRVRNR